jgi:hypothetical protein
LTRREISFTFSLLYFRIQNPLGIRYLVIIIFADSKLVPVLAWFENWLPHFPLLWWLQDLVGLVISMLLLGDFSLVLLTLLQLYSISLVDVFLVLFILPFGILLPFPVGINALFSHGPRRSAGLARLYALWNLTSFINVVSFLSNFSWLAFYFLCQTNVFFQLLRWNTIIWVLFVLIGDFVTFSIIRWLHFYVDIFITVLNPLPAKNTPAFSLGISCKGILSFNKICLFGNICLVIYF